MLIAIVGYIAVIAAVFGRVLFPPDGFLIFGDDIHRQYYFYRQFLNGFLKEGVFPWWNPYPFSGEPFVANPIVNIWYPVNWLFVLLPLNLAYSWHLAFHIFWTMLGMYFLLKTVNCKLQNENNREDDVGSGMAAWTGGVVFGLSGFFMARVWAGHVDVIAAASWMPWVTAAFVADIKYQISNIKNREKNSTESKKRFIIASLFFAMQLLAGYQTMAFMMVIAVFIVSLIHCFMVKNVRPLLRAGLAGIAGLGLAAFHLLPVQEFFRQSIRTYTFPYSWHSYGAIEWRSLLQLLNPFQFGDQYTYNGPPPNLVEQAMFIGIGGLVLALIGAASLILNFVRAKVGMPFVAHPSSLSPSTTRSPLVDGVTVLKKARLPARILALNFAVITLFGLWVSLGPNVSVDLQYLLWKFVPMYHYLRIPARHLVLVVFGLAGLAGFGFEAVLRRLPRLFKLPLRGLIAIVVVVEMVLFGRNFIELKPIPERRHDPELIALLTPQGCKTSSTPGVESKCEPFRVLQNFGVWVPPRDSLDFDSVMAYRIFSATGYDPSILKNYYEFVAAAAGKRGEQAVLDQDVQVPYLTPIAGEAIDFLNIKYIMVPLAYDPFIANSRYHLLKEDSSRKFRLYENTTVLPRFYLRDRSCGTVAVSSYTPNRLELAVDSTCDTELLSSEVWYPGWEAYVDGKKTGINKTNDAFRTLFVNKGKHTISYSYTPRIFFLGLFISILTVSGLRFFLAKNHVGPYRT